MICYIIKYAYIYYRYCAAKWITKCEQIMPGRGFSELQGLPFLSNQAKRDIEVVFKIKLYLFINKYLFKMRIFLWIFSSVWHIL